MSMQLNLESPVIKEKGIIHLTNMTSDMIKGFLEKRHKDDVFITECKNGETWGARDLYKLDAWVLKRTYSPITTIGYEIKVSRHDFENDQKWINYLDLCHEFFFVCPGGLIRSTDLPSSVGLIWVSSTGNLHIKKKAVRQSPNPEKLNRLLIYVLMARAKIVYAGQNMTEQTEIPRTQLIQEYIKKAEDNKEIYHMVKGHVRKIWDEIKKKDNEFIGRENRLKRFEERLARLGITWDSTNNDWLDNQRVENAINLLKGYIDHSTLHTIQYTGEKMIDAVKSIEKFYEANK
jgi:hypothetical protein